MKCPQCGSDSETDVRQCLNCGWDFSEQTGNSFRPRTCKLAVLAFILGILCLFTLYLPLPAAVIIGIVAIAKVRKSRGRLKGERLAMAGAVIPFLMLPMAGGLVGIVWCLDAGPVPNELTEADLVQVHPENEITWSILCQLNDEKDDPQGAPAIGLNKDDLTLLDEVGDMVRDSNSVGGVFQIVRDNSPAIQHLWDQSAKGRSVLETLHTYDQIADFTDLHVASDVPYTLDFKLLCKVNALHCLLLADEGCDLQACRELAAFDSVVRKKSITDRSLISKLVCYAIFAMDMETASRLAQHPAMSDEGLGVLQSHFVPLLEENLCLENCFKCEYLNFRNTVNQEFRAVNRVVYKHNSTCRYFHVFCHNLILQEQGQTPFSDCPVSVWPWEKPLYPGVSMDSGSAERWYDLYFLYNPVGSMLVETWLPAMEKITELKVRIGVSEDLFSWVLARRMGRQETLTARAYSEHYTVDADKGLVYSVGPDAEAFTQDDIKLRIDPAVLGLQSKKDL